MEIAVVRSAFSPFGGLEVFCLEVVRALLDRGDSVTLLTWPAQAWPLSHKKLHIIPLGCRKGPRLWQSWRFERAVSAYLSAHDFEVVFSLDRVSRFTHLHAGGGSHRAFLDMRNARSSPLAAWFRRIDWFHRYTLHLEQSGFENPMLRGVQCCSRLVAAELLRDYPCVEGRLHVIPNGIPWQAIGECFARREALGGELLLRHGLDRDRRYLLFLGSGFERKGLDIAIRGLAFLPADFALLVVGRGESRDYVRAARDCGVEERVVFLGPVAEGWQLAACSEAALLPSRYEPFGLAVAEAQAMGLPVLVSGRTGFAEWVIPGSTGVVLADTESDVAIEKAFRDLYGLMVEPAMSAGEIRQAVALLDNGVVMGRLIDGFLLDQDAGMGTGLSGDG